MHAHRIFMFLETFTAQVPAAHSCPFLNTDLMHVVWQGLHWEIYVETQMICVKYADKPILNFFILIKTL